MNIRIIKFTVYIFLCIKATILYYIAKNKHKNTIRDVFAIPYYVCKDYYGNLNRCSIDSFKRILGIFLLGNFPKKEILIHNSGYFVSCYKGMEKDENKLVTYEGKRI